MELLAFVFGNVVNFAIFILVLALLVFVHELGHFMAAKLVGVHVREFALGFGKPIWSKQIGDTLYRVNLFPLGGFVSLEGENPEESSSSSSNYQNKTWLQKAFILTGGVLMNILLAVVLFIVYLMSVQNTVVISRLVPFDFAGTESLYEYLLVTDVVDGTPAQDNLSAGDVIVSIAEQKLADTDEFLQLLDTSRGESIRIGYYSANDIGGDIQTTEVALPAERDPEKGLLGVSFFSAVYEIKYSNSIQGALSHSWNMFAYQLAVIGDSISLSVETGDATPVAQNVGSIVAVGVVIDDIIDSGQFAALISLTALVSLSLAFFNILPIPALDGGHLLITTIESITGRRLPPSTLNLINQISFFILMGLGLLVIFKDFFQFEVFSRLISGIGSVL